jgi:hypothetical protein
LVEHHPLGIRVAAVDEYLFACSRLQIALLGVEISLRLKRR